MAIIPITRNFTIVPEGTHIFRIYKVEYDAEFGKLQVHFVTAQGITHTERFSFINNDNTTNEAACGAFSSLAMAALNDSSIEAIEHTALVNHYVKAEITHTKSPSKKDPTKTLTFANMGYKWAADGFDTEPCKKALELGNETPTAPTTPKTSPVNLDALLND